MRRQLTLFLPPEQHAIVEPIRQRLDPYQSAIIQSHTTLCREDELKNWQDISRRLVGLSAFSISMQFGEPEVLADGCVLLRPRTGVEQYQQLRQAILGSSARTHDPHITLLHPRNSNGVSYNLTDIATALFGLSVTFQSFALIEQIGSDPWSLVQEFPNAG